MIKKLLILSLVVIPFYEIFLYFLIPGRVYPEFPDMRITKDFVSMIFATWIGSVVLYKYGFNAIKNKWIPIFLVFLVFNMAKAPGQFIVSGVNFTGMWNYKPAYQCFVYFFLFLGVSNLPDLDVKQIFKTIAYCGLSMAVIMCLQKYGLDQIFKVTSQPLEKGILTIKMGGTLGQNTLSSPFIVMAIPFMLYLRKWILGAFMAIIAALSNSSFTLLGLVVVIFVYTMLKVDRKWLALFFFVIIGSAMIFMAIKLYPNLLDSNGRFSMWKLVIKDIMDGRIISTGAGIGAFKYLFALKNKNIWFHAHNEYLQLVWSCGIIGAGIVFMAVKNYITLILKSLTSENKAILTSIIGIAVISCGTFLFQLAAYQYYLVILAGIIYSEKRKIVIGGFSDGLNL